MPELRTTDCALKYFDYLSSRVVAQSGIPGDKYHVGKLILQGLRDAPDLILQRDANTGESEECRSVLARSVQCARRLTRAGVARARGDVMLVMSPNSIHACIPLYAATYMGVPVSVNDGHFSLEDLVTALNMIKPTVIFCMDDKEQLVQEACSKVGIAPQRVLFGEGGSNLNEYIYEYGVDADVDTYQAEDYDTESTGFLIGTSGTTGLPKLAALSYKNIVATGPNWWSFAEKLPRPFKLWLCSAPLQWISTLAFFINSAILNYSRLHSSKPFTWEHSCELIMRYRPSHMVAGVPYLISMLKNARPEIVDFSSIEVIHMGGNMTPQFLINDLSARYPHIRFVGAYGMTETGVMLANANTATDTNAFVPIDPSIELRLVDHETGKDVTQPNVPGELWVRGPGVFKGYHNNPSETEEAITEDGWLKTGDILLKDNNDIYKFVERLKLYFKCNRNHISPLELESVIRRHPSVQDVCVTSIASCAEAEGDLPVACVVIADGHHVTAEQIKDIVNQTLTDTKQLYGGVVFMNTLPLTPSGKVDRKYLKEFVKTATRE